MESLDHDADPAASSDGSKPASTHAASSGASDRMADAAASPDASRHLAWSRVAGMRFAWAIGSAFVVESVIFGVAMLPAVLFWQWHFTWPIESEWLRLVLLAMAFLPAYLLFAVTFMALSAQAMRVLGWRTPADAEMRISDLDWALTDWARYGISTVLVRTLAGPVFRNTPVWVWYMRMNGARIGRRCWVNSLDVTDHCLLEFGDDVVIGAGVHFSGHTVERGVVKTARVKLGSGTTVGVNSHIEIDVETGPGCQIGSLSMVPKGARLDGHSVYVGAPARRLERDANRPEKN
jgi:acetyltransferase-like isoleucine patch superfamily enzyme